MEIELCCSHCPCRFQADAQTPADGIVERMTGDGLWFALGAGQIFEEMVAAALASRGTIRCPECRNALIVVCEARSHSRAPIARPGKHVECTRD